jgi:methionyl-tRNA formyltransferase
MRITILANRDIASNVALNLLLPKLADHKLSIFLSSKVGSSSNKPIELARLKFFEQDLFNDLVSPLLDKSNQRQSNFLSFSQMSELSTQAVAELNNINTPEGLQVLRENQPDLIISIRFGVILKDEAISIPPLGVLNLHSGLLPNYRGVMATFWAILNNEKTIGCTLHTINEASIDTGDIIGTTSLAVDKNLSYLSHVLQLYIAGCDLIADTVSNISTGKEIESLPQTSEGSYYSFPTANDITSFTNNGYELVDEHEITEFIINNYY